MLEVQERASWSLWLRHPLFTHPELPSNRVLCGLSHGSALNLSVISSVTKSFKAMKAVLSDNLWRHYKLNLTHTYADSWVKEDRVRIFFTTGVLMQICFCFILKNLRMNIKKHWSILLWKWRLSRGAECNHEMDNFDA